MFINPLRNGTPVRYFCGHSLGLQPETAKHFLEEELTKWSEQAVEGHFEEPRPWFQYHELLKPGLSHLCGARESEVVAYGSLTSNLHNLFATFYKPVPNKFKILAEDSGFPSDTFALQSQIEFHGFNHREGIVYLKNNNYGFTTEYILDQIKKHREALALIWLSGVNFLSGEVLDIASITKEALKYQIKVGMDLAHAIGNIPLKLHDWGVDFAVWCSYKYLNSGPGATGGYFVHEKNFPDRNSDQTILAGWWGHNAKTRFSTGTLFDPIPNADAWQHSNANVLSLSVQRASLSLFLKKDINSLYKISQSVTGLAFEKLNNFPDIRILTPFASRGNMVSILATKADKSLISGLANHNIIADWRDPGILRFSFCPLYNHEEEWSQFLTILQELL